MDPQAAGGNDEEADRLELRDARRAGGRGPRWAIPYDDEGAVTYHTDLMANCDGLLLGRRTYELFAALWPARSGTFPYVDKYNAMAKHVASTTLTDLQWENSQLIVGRGRSLLDDRATRVDLELVASTVLASGVVDLTYRPVR